MLFADANADAVWWHFVIGPVAGAAVGSLGTVLVWWLSKKRPNKIQVREVEVVSLLRVADTIRPRIAATLEGRPILGLSQIECAITNDGSETIKPVIISFLFPESTTVLECELTGVAGAVQSGDMEDQDPNVLAIGIPFLNPYRQHRDCLTAKIVCDGEPTVVQVSGRGEEWSVKHTTAESLLRRYDMNFGMALVGVFLFVLAFDYLARLALGIPLGENSVRSHLTGLPGFLFVIVFGMALLRRYRKVIRRLRLPR